MADSVVKERVVVCKGTRVGKLVLKEAIEPNGERKSRRRWLCQCDCGKEKIIDQGNLVAALRYNDGRGSRSCGCSGRRSERMSKMATRHGYARKGKVTSVFLAWSSLFSRCNNPNHKYYHRYGGRGIKICERWTGKDGFVNFLADMGDKPTPKHTIDRYPNGDGNYEPGNCRWATMKEQLRNRPGYNRMVEVDGAAICVGELAERIGRCKDVLYKWLGMGFSGQLIADTAKRVEKVTPNALREIRAELEKEVIHASTQCDLFDGVDGVEPATG